MKKNILVVGIALCMFGFSNIAEARIYNKNTQYSTSIEQDNFNPLDKILGTDNQGWSVSPRLSTKIKFVHFYSSPSIVSYGRMLQSQGIRVSEHPSFGGVHHVHHGHGHYAGRAIDINVGRGVVEASNPRTRHWFDNVAARARAAGYMVLWKVAGHFNHMHIEKR